MRLALAELRRQPRRFVTAWLVLTLLSLLLMFLGGLLDGLIDQSVSAIRRQNSDLVTYSDTARESLVRSRVTAEERAAAEAVDGVEAVGGLGAVQLGARLDGRDERDLIGTVLFGYEIPPNGVEDPPPPGQAWADDTLQAEGVEVGSVLLLGPLRSPVEVAGFVSGLEYSGQSSLWADPATWREVQGENRPDAVVTGDTFAALVVQVSEGHDPEEVAEAIDAATDSTTTLTLSQAVAGLPGVSEQESTFNQIIGVTVLVAVVVIALFFALLTVERTALYGVLKALGASSGKLLRVVVIQAVAIALAATLTGTILAVALDLALPPGSIPYQLGVSRVVLSTAALLIAAVVGCAFSLRRVLRIDPASAIGSST